MTSWDGDGDAYDRRFEALAESGQDMHGESGGAAGLAGWQWRTPVAQFAERHGDVGGQVVRGLEHAYPAADRAAEIELGKQKFLVQNRRQLEQRGAAGREAEQGAAGARHASGGVGSSHGRENVTGTAGGRERRLGTAAMAG